MRAILKLACLFQHIATGFALTAQGFQAIGDVLDLAGLNIADISHEVSNISFVVSDLLVNIVIAEDLVDCLKLALW